MKKQEKDPLQSVTTEPEQARGVSNATLFRLLTILQAVPKHCPKTAAAGTHLASSAQMAEQLTAILQNRLNDGSKATGGPGRAPTLYRGMDSERGLFWLRGAAEVAEFLGRPNAKSVQVQLARRNAKGKELEAPINRSGRIALLNVRRATDIEIAHFTTVHKDQLRAIMPPGEEKEIKQRRGSGESPKEKRLRLEKEGKEDV